MLYVLRFYYGSCETAQCAHVTRSRPSIRNQTVPPPKHGGMLLTAVFLLLIVSGQEAELFSTLLLSVVLPILSFLIASGDVEGPKIGEYFAQKRMLVLLHF